MSTKNTILKRYDGRFKDIFQEIYEALVGYTLKNLFSLVTTRLFTEECGSCVMKTDDTK